MNKRTNKLVQLKLMKRIAQPIQRKTMVNLLDQRTTKKIQLQIMLSRNIMYLQKKEKLFKQHTRAFYV